jgi:hypothetical protein
MDHQDYSSNVSTVQMINPLNSFIARNTKSIAYISTETLHNTIFHFIETVKVRGQARNLKSGDVSHYFKN